MKRALLLLGLFACGGPTVTPVVVPVVSVDASAPDAATSVVVDASRPSAADASVAAPVWKATLVGEVALGTTKTWIDGPSFTSDDARVAVVVDGKLRMFDATTLAPVAMKGGTLTKATGPLLVVGRFAFDPTSGAQLVLASPAPFQCEPDSDAFSQNGTRASRYCTTANNEGTIVLDTHTGALVGTFHEFQTAAPVRVGTITASGNFVFWSARASGAFEEISSKVTGPAVSSHTTMSPDERFLFTAPDRNWYSDAAAVGELIDAKKGKTLLRISGEVDGGVFSPSSKLLAVLHKEMGKDPQSVTIHDVEHAPALVKLPDVDVGSVGFSVDDTRVAVVTASHKLRVYRLEAP